MAVPKITSSKLTLTVCTLATLITASTHAIIIPFDLQGKAGFGLLTGNEAPSVPASGGSGGELGTGILFDDATNLITINIGWGTANGFNNLTGNASAGHIHQPTPSLPPASFNEATGVLVGLNTQPGWNPSASGGGFNGAVTIPAASVPVLLEGRLYINIHTATNSGGEIRGNLIRASPTLAVPESGSTLALLALPLGAWWLFGAICAAGGQCRRTEGQRGQL